MRASPVVGSAVIGLIGNAATPIAVLVTAPILARELGVVGRGGVAAVTAPLLLANAILTFGLPDAVTHAIAKFGPIVGRRLARTACWVVAGAGILGTAGVVVYGHFLHSDYDLRAVTYASACFLPPSLLLLVARSRAAGIGAWRRVALEKIVGGCTRAALTVVLALSNNLTVQTASLAIAASLVVGHAAYLRMPPPRNVDWSNEDGSPSSNWLLRYGGSVWFGSLAGYLLLRLDQVLMAPLSSLSQLGIYAVAVNISEVPLVINTTIREIAFTKVSKSGQSEDAAWAARLSGAIALTICVLLSAPLPLLIPFIFGDEFTGAIVVSYILIAAVALGTPGSLAGVALSALGRPGLRSASLVVAAVVNILMIFTLVPSMGAVGAAIATLAGNLIASNANILWVNRVAGTQVRDFYAVRLSDFRRLRKVAPE